MLSALDRRSSRPTASDVGLNLLLLLFLSGCSNGNETVTVQECAVVASPSQKLFATITVRQAAVGGRDAAIVSVCDAAQNCWPFVENDDQSSVAFAWNRDGSLSILSESAVDMNYSVPIQLQNLGLRSVNASSVIRRSATGDWTKGLFAPNAISARLDGSLCTPISADRYKVQNTSS